jgi:hypothetical protein
MAIGSLTDTKSIEGGPAPKKSTSAAKVVTREDLNRPIQSTKDDLETKMGRVYEKDNYYLGLKLDRESPSWWKFTRDLEPDPVDENLTAERVFDHMKGPHTLLQLNVGTYKCHQDCAANLSEEQKLRLWGMFRIHYMAAFTVYNNRCGYQPSSDLKLIESQFRKLPKDAQEKSLDHEIKGIEAVEDRTYDGVFMPGGWTWFCDVMHKDIETHRADYMFSTARDIAANGITSSGNSSD